MTFLRTIVAHDQTWIIIVAPSLLIEDGIAHLVQSLIGG